MNPGVLSRPTSRARASPAPPEQILSLPGLPLPLESQPSPSWFHPPPQGFSEALSCGRSRCPPRAPRYGGVGRSQVTPASCAKRRLWGPRGS